METERDLSASLLAGSAPEFDIVCIPCKSEGKHLEAEGYCMDCCEHLCDQCFKYHRTLSAVKHHKLVDKENMPLSQKSSVRKDVCTEQCSIHSGKIIEYFCPTHKVLGCNVCVTLKHKQCEDVAYIPEVSAGLEKSQEYKTFKQHLEKLIQKSDVIFNSAEQNLEKCTDAYTRNKRAICAFRQEINTTIDKLETDMKYKLEQINTENTEALQAVSKEASRVKDELQAMSADFHDLISKKQNCKTFSQMKSTESDILKLQDTLENMDELNYNVLNFYPNLEVLQMLKGADVLGKLWNTSKLRADHVADINTNVIPNYPPGFSQLTRTPEDLFPGTLRKSSIPYSNGVTVVSREKLVAIDSNKRTVILIDSVNNKVTFQLQIQHHPWTVTTITKNTVAVTQPKANQILFLTCDNKLVIVKAVRVKGACCGIAYYKNKLIVTFCNPGKLEILSMTGEVLRRLTYDKERQLLIVPYYVSVDPQKPAIFVSDWRNDSLIKLSMDGEILAIYRDRDLSEIRQCAVGQGDLVFLCGMKSNNIHLLTSECTKIKTILTRSDRMDNPCSVSYCEATGRLFVGVMDNARIQVYQLHD